MGWASGLTVYFVTWWIALFAVLPWGIRTDATTGQVGAPQSPMLLKKFIATTIVSAILWLLIYWLVNNQDFLPFRHMAKEMPI